MFRELIQREIARRGISARKYAAENAIEYTAFTKWLKGADSLSARKIELLISQIAQHPTAICFDDSNHGLIFDIKANHVLRTLQDSDTIIKTPTKTLTVSELIKLINA